MQNKKIITKSDLSCPQIKEIQRHGYPAVLVVTWAWFCYLCSLSSVWTSLGELRLTGHFPPLVTSNIENNNPYVLGTYLLEDVSLNRLASGGREKSDVLSELMKSSSVLFFHIPFTMVVRSPVWTWTDKCRQYMIYWQKPWRNMFL